MTEPMPDAMSGFVLDESIHMTLEEFCRAGKVETELVIEMVTEGVLDPQGGAPSQWLFDVRGLKRLHAALRLQQDLGVNLPGAALALDLLEELEELRRKI